MNRARLLQSEYERILAQRGETRERSADAAPNALCRDILSAWLASQEYRKRQGREPGEDG